MEFAAVVCGGPYGMFGHGTEEDQNNIDLPVYNEDLTPAVKAGLENFKAFKFEEFNGRGVEFSDGELASFKFQSADKTYSYYPVFALVAGFLMAAGELDMEQIYKGWRFARQEGYFGL